MAFVAAVEVDQRQRLIASVDTLKEMLGGSWTIEDTIEEARKIQDAVPLVKPIKVVSGELWLRYEHEDLAELEKALWTLRERFVRELQIPCSFVIVEELNGDPILDTQKKLTDEVSRVKNGKASEIGFPALPWFAPCLIQPDLFATEWHTDREHRRRVLLNQASVVRLKQGSKTLERYLNRFPKYHFKQPNSFDDFRCGEENSWFAVIRLDADRNSKVFTEHPWTNWDELTKCSEAIERSLKSALDFAVQETIKTARTTTETFPISPMIAAGEDFLIVARRDLAIPLTLHLMKKYQELANANDCLQSVTSGNDQLTLSGGILFARLAYPFSQLNEIVTDLEHSSKSHRATQSTSNERGCVDLYWLDSSGRESPIEQRARELRYRHGLADIYQLFSTPWTDDQFEAVWDSANNLLDAGIARGKWHDIQRLLRLGMPLSGLAWKMWQNDLEKTQRDKLRDALTALRAVELWPLQAEQGEEPWIKKSEIGSDSSPYVTVLDELHRIIEMIRVPAG